MKQGRWYTVREMPGFPARQAGESEDAHCKRAMDWCMTDLLAASRAHEIYGHFRLKSTGALYATLEAVPSEHGNPLRLVGLDDIEVVWRRA